MATAQPYTFNSIEIEINHECNRSCAYCPNSISARKNQGRMPEPLFRNLMTQLRELDYRGRISYHFYNEPLLSPDLDRFVDITKFFLPASRIELYTNGDLLTETRLRSLSSRGVDRFLVTKHHGKDPYPFEDLVPRLEIELRDKVKFQNYRDLRLTNRGGLLKIGKGKDALPLNLPCYIPSTLLVVTVNGNILPCFEDFDEKHVMGNLQESRLLDIWNSAKYRGFRDDLKQRRRNAHPVCDSCNCRLILP